MSADEKVDDWEAALQRVGGRGGPAGLKSLVFIFQSRTLRKSLAYNFFGVMASTRGLTPLSAAMAVAGGPTSNSGTLSRYYRLSCRRPISANEIHRARGSLRITSIGVGSRIGSGLVDSYLSFQASRDGEVLFSAPRGFMVKEGSIAPTLGWMYGVWMGGRVG